MQAKDYWQTLAEPGSYRPGLHPAGFVAELADGRQMLLPLRRLADGHHALASLIINQASFMVQEALARQLAERIAILEPEVVVGLPTLGLTLASAVARHLGHSRYVPLGTSRKFWYSDELSAPISSITTPDQSKRLYVDPRMLPLLEGKRVALIDDVISTGKSIVAGLSLMERIGIEPVVIGVAMLQSQRWRPILGVRSERVECVFTTPLLNVGPDGRIIDGE